MSSHRRSSQDMNNRPRPLSRTASPSGSESQSKGFPDPSKFGYWFETKEWQDSRRKYLDWQESERRAREERDPTEQILQDYHARVEGIKASGKLALQSTDEEESSDSSEQDNALERNAHWFGIKGWEDPRHNDRKDEEKRNPTEHILKDYHAHVEEIKANARLKLPRQYTESTDLSERHNTAERNARRNSIGYNPDRKAVLQEYEAKRAEEQKRGDRGEEPSRKPRVRFAKQQMKKYEPKPDLRANVERWMDGISDNEERSSSFSPSLNLPKSNSRSRHRSVSAPAQNSRTNADPSPRSLFSEDSAYTPKERHWKGDLTNQHMRGLAEFLGATKPVKRPDETFTDPFDADAEGD